MPFPYKCVLVTGATSGIGRALAERMIDNGTFVIAVGRRRERLDELVQRHGKDKVAAEVFDVSEIEKLPDWVARLTQSFPNIDAIVLNAGFQYHPVFLSPDSLSLDTLSSEVNTNYLSPLHTSTLFLRHLQNLSKIQPTSIILVTSGLAIVPSLRAPTYSAIKAALRSFAWSLRATLAADFPAFKVMEIIPPAVQTELRATPGSFLGMPLDEFMEEAWSGLVNGQDEIPVGIIKERVIHVEDERKKAFDTFCTLVPAPRLPTPGQE